MKYNEHGAVYVGESKLCTCDSCIYLGTDLGQAMLDWSSHFVAECKGAVKFGVDAEKTIALNMNGPSSRDLAFGFEGRGKVYVTYEFNIANVAKYAPSLAETPDFDVLLEEYADDPVLVQTLTWMKKRYG